MAGEARRADDGTLVAEAEASFMVEPGPATPQALSGGGASNTPMS
jgi:hypothetical protein